MTIPLYLDIDGTLNAMNGKKLDEAWKNVSTARMRKFHARGYKIQYHPRLPMLINRLGVKIIWHTTWGNHAQPEIGDVMHLHGVGYTRPGEFRMGSSIFWKAAALLEDIKDGRPFIWADDEIYLAYQLAPEGYMDQFSNGLILCPDPLVGLTPEDVQKMEDYIKEHDVEARS